MKRCRRGVGFSLLVAIVAAAACVGVGEAGFGPGQGQGASGAASGPAGGDLGGSFPNPTVLSLSHVTGGMSAALDVLGLTRGSILYRGAAGWAILAPGTSGNVLTSNGAGADPSYRAGGGGGALSAVLVAGNTTGGRSILFSSGDGITAAANLTIASAMSSQTAINLLSDGSDEGSIFVVKDLGTDGRIFFMVDDTGNVVTNKTGSALATNATTGFTYLPTCAGVPSGVPGLSITGATSTVIDSTDGRFYAYYAGAWHNLSGYPPSLTAETSGFTAAANNAYTNTGASADLIGTLPAAPAIGTVVDFFVTVAHKVEILAPASVTIYAGATSTGTAGFIESSTIGSTAHCTYVATNTWVVLIGGTWLVNT